MLYAAKCYWPGVSGLELENAAARASARPEGAYLGSLLFLGDDLVLCLFEASSAAAVRSASERAGLPCERVMEAVWLADSTREGIHPCKRL